MVVSDRNRESKMAVTTSTRMGVTLWSSDADNFTRTQMNGSHENIELVAARFTAGSANPTLPDSSYARSFFYNTSTGVLHYSFNGNDWDEIVTEASVATLTGTETLTNKTLTAPVISTISNTGTVTLPTSTTTLVGRDTTDTLTNKTLSEPTIKLGISQSPVEQWQVVAAAPTGTQNIDCVTSAAWYYTANTTTNFTANLRGDSGTTFDSLLSVGQSMSVVIAVQNASNPRYLTGLTIDGSSQTVLWAADTSPTAGNANSIDTYLLTVIKTSAAPGYTVFGQQVQFA